MTDLVVWIPGEPRGKGRPRFARMPKGVRTYKDARTESYENLVTLAATRALASRIGTFDSRPVSVAVTAYLRKSKNRKKTDRYPTKKPDVNNVVAAILDGLTQAGVWVDDSYVAELHARKLWATTDQEPGVRVRIVGMTESA